MPTLVVRHPDGQEQEQPLSGSLRVGRAEGNDLILKEGGVSREHARFFVEDGKVMVEDAGSSNGTFVNGERITGPVALSARIKVILGDYEISLKAPKPRASGDRPSPKGPKPTKLIPEGQVAAAAAKLAPEGRPQRPASVDGPCLRGLTGPWMNKVYRLKTGSTVGRAPGLDVYLDDESVSRRHAEFTVRLDEVVLRDLGSSNGSHVNGQKLKGEEVLADGDVVQFGVVELEFLSGEGQLLDEIPRRSSGNAASSASGTRWIIATVVVSLLVVLGLGKLMLWPSKPDQPRDPVVEKPVAQLDEAAQLSEYLSQCRSYASVESGSPNWQRAEAACNKALDIDPIHGEANQLIRRIRLEQECEEHFSRGDKAMVRSREEEALEHFAKIGPSCSYYVKVKSKVKEAIDGVMKKAGEDCKRYVSSGHFDTALPRCELYMKFACQNMSKEQLYPPPGYKISTAGRLGKDEWRPKDAMYVRLLQARQKVDPNATSWECPPLPILRKDDAPEDPLQDVRKELDRRFDDKQVSLAMLTYFQGRAGEAITMLAKVQEQQARAKFHATAKALQRDVGDVDSLFKEGQSALGADDPERAAEPFREALEKDAVLMGESLAQVPSFFRRNIQTNFAQAAYEKGKLYADRDDFRRACKVWKLGMSFYKGNIFLLRALGNACSGRAVEALERADGCEKFDLVLDFAVDGDGIKEKVEAKKAELKCE